METHQPSGGGRKRRLSFLVVVAIDALDTGADLPPETQQITSSTTTRSSASTLISPERVPRLPHSLGRTFSLWCQQSFQVFAWPSPATFATQQGKTDWRLILILMFGWTSIAALLASVTQPLSPNFLTLINLPVWVRQASLHPMSLTVGTFLGLPLTFLLWMGMLYLWYFWSPLPSPLSEVCSSFVF